MKYLFRTTLLIMVCLCQSVYSQDNFPDQADDQYLIGDWNGDTVDNVAVRRGATILMDTNFDGKHDLIQTIGEPNRGDNWYSGDWDGDGRDNIGIRRGATFYLDTNFDGQGDIIFDYGYANDKEILIGDWDGDGRDNVAIRRGATIFMDYDFSGVAEREQTIGFENDQFISGDWDGDGKDNIGVHRGATFYLDTNFDVEGDIVFDYGFANDKYVLVGDWDGDGRDNIAIRRGAIVIMDINFDGEKDIELAYGYGVPEPSKGQGWFVIFIKDLGGKILKFLDSLEGGFPTVGTAETPTDYPPDSKVYKLEGGTACGIGALSGSVRVTNLSTGVTETKIIETCKTELDCAIITYQLALEVGLKLTREGNILIIQDEPKSTFTIFNASSITKVN